MHLNRRVRKSKIQIKVMSTARIILFHTALKAAESKSVGERILVYRALAEFSGTPEAAQPLTSLARELEGIEARHRQVTLEITGGVIPRPSPVEVGPLATTLR